MSKEPLYYGIDMKATGENISRLRKAKGLTVKDVQNYMGFEQPQAVYKWERGETIPSLERLMALSRIFDVRMEDILIWRRPLPD